MNTDEKYIAEAIKIAKEATSVYGALLVKNGEIISKGTNKTESTNDPTAHAEIVVIREAARKLGTRYLEGCVLYSTTEPCAMCISAAIWSRMERVVFGANISDLIKFYGKRQIVIPAQYVVDKGSPKLILSGNCLRNECLELFKA
jgi:tRNA(Arg) A34 adenosine deaminase TadA